MRQVFCARQLAESFDIYVTGLEDGCASAGISLKETDLTERGQFDGIVLPVPPLKDCGEINAPLGRRLTAAELCPLLKKGGVVFTGRSDVRLSRMFPQAEIIDYMSREDLSLKNAIPTAEGAVKIALEELPVTLNGLPALIVGAGRIGSALAVILRGFGADVTIAVRNAKGAAKARILGAKSVCTRDMGCDYRLIFNTAPELVFKSAELERFSPDTLFIDLASRPGGIDFDCAEKLGLRTIWALGLPGKTAPVTAGEIVAETITAIIEEGGGCHE